MRSKFRVMAIGAALTVALPAGCGGGARSADELSGIVTIDGSSTVFRISKAAQVGYARSRRNDVEVLLNNSGTGGGFGKYLRGELDIIDASRPATEEEQQQARELGLEWTRFVVGYDGITVAVNPANDFCESLSVAQLREMFRPGSPIRNWRQVDPSYPDLDIVYYSPDNDSGTYEYFTEAIVGRKNAQRKDVQASSDDNVLVTGVAGDRGGIGYFGYAYYDANRARLKAVAIRADPDTGPVSPTRETILSGAYRPLSRPLYTYVKDAALGRPEVRDFLTYYITNIRDLATRAHYVPPNAEDQAENLARLPGGALTGSEAGAKAAATPSEAGAGAAATPVPATPAGGSE